MNYLILVLKGIAMGVANVIPGVSGGTIAFITGIYERLLGALKAFDATAFRLLVKFDFAGLFRHIDFSFLVAPATPMPRATRKENATVSRRS